LGTPERSGSERPGKRSAQDDTTKVVAALPEVAGFIYSAPAWMNEALRTFFDHCRPTRHRARDHRR
jgi:hypothetical protein